MVVRLTNATPEARYRGLRMSADEFLALPEDPVRYELIDGVVQMSPSASYRHQQVHAEIFFQVCRFLDAHPLGSMVADIDIRLRDDLVYRPDLVFLTAAKAALCHDRVTEVPDLIVEIISPDSRAFDSQTKLHDYEAAGVGEYWLIDPLQQSMRFFVLTDGTYRDAAPATPNRFASSVLRGFELDLDRLRALS